MHHRQIVTFLSLSIAALTFGGCQSSHVSQWNGVHSAVAVMHATAGNNVAGWVMFEDVDGGVRVTAEVTGLTPNQKHAFHIHQYGDGRAADGTSAGSHYDPQHTMHHADVNMAMPHHAGDLGNLQADANGRASYNKVIDDITVAGLTSPIIGRGVIIHVGVDQFSQPVGAAGGRMAFGAIGVANPDYK